jgi:hypothetical protein
MPGPWEKYGQQAAPQAPVIAPPDPYKQANEQRAQADQSMQADAARRDEERLRLATDEAARKAVERQQGVDATESERKAGAFLIRALGANEAYEGTGVGPRGIVGQAFQDAAPNLSNVLVNSPERQTADSAQDEFVAASLRQDSGAAIPPEELERQRRIYFPMPGDAPQVIEQKRQARIRAIEGLRQSAGRLEAGAEQRFQGLLEKYGAADVGGHDPEAAVTDRWPGVVGEDGKPLPPGGGYGKDPATGEWSMYGVVTADGGPTAAESEAARLNELQGEKGLTSLAGEGMMLGFGDETAGVGTAIGRALTGDFDITGNYELGRDADRIRTSEARDRLGWAGTGAEILGGGALGKLEAGGNALMQAGRTVAARGAPVTRAAIQSQMARTAAQDGATMGAIGGFGYGEGLQGSSTNALLGGATGGALGYGGQRIGNALANRSRAQPQVSGAQVQQAADDLNIPVIPAVTGGTTARRLTSGARQGFISDRPISRAVDAMEAGGGAARDRAAAATGRALDGEDAGNIVRQAANVYSRRTSDIGGKLYDRADNMAGGVTLPLPRAVTVADAWLTKLAKSVDGTGGTLYRDVKSLRDKMAAGQFEVDGIRQTRTALREQLQERGLRGSATDKVMGEILDAATDDLFDGLTGAGKQNAANALRTANAFWKKRVETIDEVLEPVLGRNSPRSGEQIVTAIEGLAKPKSGNAARLRQLFDAMPANEAKSVAATIITRMGQPTPGAAQTGGGFSFNTFLTNWNNMSPRARTAMFPTETRSALDKLATVAQGVKQAGSAANTSNTAGALGVQALISTPLIWLAEPMTVVAATGGQWAVGRLLASPKVARWIAGAPSNPQARGAYIARLGGIARAEPALANEIGLLDRALRASNDNAAIVTGVAAQEPEARQQ